MPQGGDLSQAPEPPQYPTQIGDIAIVVEGEFQGLRGVVYWISQVDGLLWIMGAQGTEYSANQEENNELVTVLELHCVLERPPTITYTREKGYDVTVGDLLRVVRGENVSIEGLVHEVDFNNAHVVLICNLDGRKVSP
jgi:ribosomal protein L24